MRYLQLFKSSSLCVSVCLAAIAGRFLFPPGLLALAGLLWLGGVALGWWQGLLHPLNVMTMTLPSLHDYGKGWASPIQLPQQELNNFRNWQDAEFTGQSIHDAQEKQRVMKAVRAMLADTQHEGGVRIRFASTARYEYLVFVIDLMNQENIKRYWLDIRERPSTFYTLTKKNRLGFSGQYGMRRNSFSRNNPLFSTLAGYY